jgi:PhnB protein
MREISAFGPSELGPLVVQLTVSDAKAAIAYYRAVFCADELYRNTENDRGRVVHCELLIRGARVAVHDEFPEFDLLAPTSLAGASVSLNLYVEDVDLTFGTALEKGGRRIADPQDRFWGARSGSFLDPFGHRWVVTTQVDDPSPEEIIIRSKSAPIGERLSAAPNRKA